MAWHPLVQACSSVSKRMSRSAWGDVAALPFYPFAAIFGKQMQTPQKRSMPIAVASRKDGVDCQIAQLGVARFQGGS